VILKSFPESCRCFDRSGDDRGWQNKRPLMFNFWQFIYEVLVIITGINEATKNVPKRG
jgi:hypothetical protein